MAEQPDIQRAADRLRSGGVVAFPTETVYGLGADALNAGAVSRVFELKGRPPGNPLIVHVSDTAMAMTVTSRWPVIASKLADAFWPGPLTLVLPKSPSVPPAVTAGGPTVAVRVPDHELALDLIRAFGGPIVGPSANPSGYVSPTSARHVSTHWTDDEVLCLDGGPCGRGIESTVLDLSSGMPGILRRGVLGADRLEPVLGHPLRYAAVPAGSEACAAVSSPGLLGPHYRPRAPVRLVEEMTDLNPDIAEADGPVVLLGPPGRRVRIQPPHVAIDMPGSGPGYAQKLYSALRDADEHRPAQIIVVFPRRKDSEVWDAIRERLRRAAS